MLLVSIITPTSEREKFLPLIYKVIQNQQFEGNWEWLISDSSFRPSPFIKRLKDSRIRYFYDYENLKIGAKRNFLKKEAQGNIIVHFDDDDFYSPFYLKKVISVLQDADFCKLSSFFCYASQTKEFFYWDTSHLTNTRYLLSPLTGKMIQEIDFSNMRKSETKRHKKGYGFSYAYKKEVAEKADFRNVNFGEDVAFFHKAEKQKFRINLFPDEEGLVIHIVHDMNTSMSFPQYRIPKFLTKKLFPTAESYLKKYPCR